MTKSMKLAPLAILAATLIAGCQPIPSAEKMAAPDLKNLVEGPKGAASTTFLGLFYCGDHGGFSYFVLRRRLDKDRWIKIETSLWPASKRMNFVGDDKRWIESHKAAIALSP